MANCVCEICHKPFEGRTVRAECCDNPDCRKERKRRQNLEYKRKLKADTKAYKAYNKQMYANRKEQMVHPEKQNLVDSICPKCRVHHKGSTRWEYCPVHTELRFHGDTPGDWMTGGIAPCHR